MKQEEILTVREIKKRMDEVWNGIKIAKRAGGKAPRTLVDYLNTLSLLTEWTSKKKLADTKFDKYNRAVRRIAKRLNKHERSES
jgi:hypothetical protein